MIQTEENSILVLQDVSKSFPGVKALSNVNLVLRKGEVHALIGENGAGKSTLMKILSGAYKKDEGHIFIDGKEVSIESPRMAEQLGIAIIYQELNLMNGLSVAENIYIGRQPKKRGTISWKTMYKQAQLLLDSLGIAIDVKRKVGSLSVAQQQMVEIAKAISLDAKVVIMDEPTSSLTTQEIRILFSIIKKLKEKQVSIIFISHRLDEIFEISDRLTILRDGQYIATKNTKDTNRSELISMMIGRELTQQYPARESKIGEVMLRVKNLSGVSKIHDVSFEVRRGEVLGFAGLVGSGRTEVMRLIFGADPRKSGTILLNDKEIRVNNPRNSIRSGIGFVTEDRKGEGLLLPFPVSFNISLIAIEKIKKWRILNMKRDAEAAKKYVDELRIVTPSVRQKIVFLSGGNQQKVVLAKWLFSDSEVIIMDEPTRGIDVGAKREIYEIINRLASEGKAIIVVSSELEEVMGICDRILVMREGSIEGEVMKKDFSQQLITEYAVGGRI